MKSVTSKKHRIILALFLKRFFKTRLYSINTFLNSNYLPKNSQLNCVLKWQKRDY